MISTLILLGIYLIVAVAAQAYAGVDQLVANQEDVLSALGTEVFGSPLDKILIIAVLTSAAASTQTTILPTARTTLSMARANAMPKSLGKVHPRFLTPHISTVLMGVASIVWYVGLTLVSEDILFDSLAALGLMIAFYIGLTGFACAIYYRRELFRSVKNFFFVGLGPLIGGVILFYLLIKNAIELSDPANSESGNSWLGVGPPLVIAAFFLVLGVVLMLCSGARCRPSSSASPRWRPPGSSRAKRRCSRSRSHATREGAEMSQIVVGYDGSDCGEAALDEGSDREGAGRRGRRRLRLFAPGALGRRDRRTRGGDRRTGREGAGGGEAAGRGRGSDGGVGAGREEALGGDRRDGR